MSRFRIEGMVALAAAGALGCAHCDECDDFPAPIGVPYATAPGGAMPYGPTGYHAGPAAGPAGDMMLGPAPTSAGQSPHVPAIVPPPEPMSEEDAGDEANTTPETGTDADTKGQAPAEQEKAAVVPDPDAKPTRGDSPPTSPPTPGRNPNARPRQGNVPADPPIVPIP